MTLAPADGGGARVAGGRARSVAASAGLRRGDVIVEAAGAAVATPADLRAVVEVQAPGTWLPLRVRRDGRDRQVVARFEPAVMSAGARALLAVACARPRARPRRRCTTC